MSYERHVMYPRIASLALAASLPLFTLAGPATGAAAAPLPPAQAPAALTAAPAAVTPAPKNVIVMIGDGMGFNQLDAGTLFRDGTSSGQVNVTAGGSISHVAGVLPPELAGSDVQLSVRTTQYGASYDPSAAWSSFGYVLDNPTDSAAAATAMATGTKTSNGAIGVDITGATLENLTEYAVATGRKAGVVTTVPFSHATPAGFSAHDVDRNHYKAIARDQLNSKLSVVMGAGHPWYTDNHNKRSSAKYTYLYKSDYKRLARGTSGFTYLTSKKRFKALTTGSAPKRVFGLARVASTLQEKRKGATDVPGAKLNGVPSLAMMTAGALNVLDSDPDGLFLMVEGGAIDWANHASEKGRVLEETGDFLDAIGAVNSWVETHSSWAETLLIVTADHESGYLTGAGSNPDWTAITGTAGAVPAMSYHSSGHTRQLVPLFARGAGASLFTAEVVGDDPVRGAYVDNTSIAAVVERLWP